jgi:hypothetical protein
VSIKTYRFYDFCKTGCQHAIPTPILEKTHRNAEFLLYPIGGVATKGAMCQFSLTFSCASGTVSS